MGKLRGPLETIRVTRLFCSTVAPAGGAVRITWPAGIVAENS
jgi:hypothetical protein